MHWNPVWIIPQFCTELLVNILSHGFAWSSKTWQKFYSTSDVHSHTNVHLAVFNVAYKWTDDGSLLMALNSGHISNHKRTSRDIYNINDLQIGYWRTTILVMIHHWWSQNQVQFSNVQSFLSSSDTRLSLSLKTWSTGMPLYHISQISTLSIVVICLTMIYRSQSQWGGSWEDLLLYCLLAEQDLQHCWP